MFVTQLGLKRRRPYGFSATITDISWKHFSNYHTMTLRKGSCKKIPFPWFGGWGGVEGGRGGWWRFCVTIKCGGECFGVSGIFRVTREKERNLFVSMLVYLVQIRFSFPPPPPPSFSPPPPTALARPHFLTAK